MLLAQLLPDPLHVAVALRVEAPHQFRVQRWDEDAARRLSLLLDGAAYGGAADSQLPGDLPDREALLVE